MRRTYTADRVPYELEKDRSRAYFAPGSLREMQIKPGAYVKVAKGEKSTVLRAVPKFDGDGGAVYLPAEEIAQLEIKTGSTVSVEKDLLEYPEAKKVRVLFKTAKKSVERLESVKLVLEDKKAVQNRTALLGGLVLVGDGDGDGVGLDGDGVGDRIGDGLDGDDVGAIKKEGLYNEKNDIYDSSKHTGNGTALSTAPTTLYKITERTIIEVATEEKELEKYQDLEAEREALTKIIREAHEKGSERSCGVIVTGGVGAGKKNLVLNALEEIGAEWVRVKAGPKDKEIAESYEYAKINEPCTVWIDRIDRMFEESSRVAGIIQIEEILEDIWRHKRRISIVATALSLAEVPEEVRTWRLLDREVHVPPPKLDQRRAMVEEAKKIHVKSTGCKCSHESEKEIEKIALRTAGFSRGDISLVLRDSLYPFRKQEKEKLDPEKVEKDLLNMKIGSTRGVLEGAGGVRDNSASFGCDKGCFGRVLKEIVKITPSAASEKPAEVPHIRLEDICGQERAKKVLVEAVAWPIRHAKVFEEVGVLPSKGVLLYGPPGCGKTLIAQALANESGAAFYSVRGPEVMGKYVGESEERVRRVFEKARGNAPAIIFVDEIDSIAPHREAEGGQVDKRVVSTLLTEMDGIGAGAGVFVLGATNKPWSIDSALMRPGRFDHHVLIDLPESAARKELVEKKTKKAFESLRRWEEAKKIAEEKKIEEKDVISRVVRRTEGFTGAEVAGVAGEILLEIVRLKIEEEKGDAEITKKNIEKIIEEAKTRVDRAEVERFRRYSREGV